MKTLFSIVALLALTLSGFGQGGIVTLQGNLITGSNTGTGNTPVLVLQNQPTFSLTTGTNIFYNAPHVTGTAAIVVTGGTSAISLTGTGAVSGASLGNAVYIQQPLPVALPAGTSIYGAVTASGTAVLTITVTGTTVVPSGTYQITTATAH